MKKVAFLVNKVAHNYTEIVKEIERNFNYATDCKLFISQQAGHIKDLAGQACAENYEYLIVVGGDGTMNEAVNGIVEHFKIKNDSGADGYDWAAVKKIKIGLLPAGTGNDFARYHDLKFDTNYLKFLIEKDNTQTLDIGFTTFINRNGQKVERFFCNITDVGMGGNTAHHIHEHKISWLSSSLNYSKAILSSFITYEKSPVRWTSEDTTWEGKIMSMVVANGQFFGSGLGVAPDAKMNDGLFTLVTLGDITMWDYVKNLGKVKKSIPLKHKEIAYHHAKKVKIESLDGKQLPIDMDGEFVGFCPLTLECIPNAITFLV
jgi:diacylglycerol kinase (ATP)